MSGMGRVPLMLLMLSLGACSTTPGGPESIDKELREAAQINLRLGMGYIQSGRYETAQQKLEKALEYDPTLLEAYNALGVMYEEMGKMGEAEQNYRRAAERADRYPTAVMNHARVLCTMGDYATGESQYQRLFDASDRETKANAYTGAAQCAIEAKEPVRAESHLRLALENEPGNTLALIELADLLQSQSQHLQARGYIQRYHELAGYSPRSLFLAVSIARSLNDSDGVKQYSTLLKSRFAQSPEAQRLVN